MDGTRNLILKGPNCIEKKKDLNYFFLTNWKIFFRCGTDRDQNIRDNRIEGHEVETEIQNFFMHAPTRSRIEKRKPYRPNIG
jgi:hypothetical protein